MRSVYIYEIWVKMCREEEANILKYRGEDDLGTFDGRKGGPCALNLVNKADSCNRCDYIVLSGGIS